MCVLCEAVSRSTAIAAVFYLDAFRAAGMSLIHHGVHAMSSGCTSKNRPWFCGVGDPGTGKSHAAEPHGDMVREVCEAHSFHAPGTSADSAHLIMTRTYAGFESNMHKTDGYGLKLS